MGHAYADPIKYRHNGKPITDDDRPWRAKAEREIAALSEASYRHVNYDKSGRKYRRHRPYTVPALALELCRCLGDNDEETAKAIFHRIAYLTAAGTDPTTE